MATTVRDILTFHKLDRHLFEKLMAMGKPLESSKNIIGLWMWLEVIHIDVIKHIHDSYNNTLFLQFVAEAERILGCLRQGAPLPNEQNMAIPHTASLVVGPLNLRFFYYHRDIAIRGIACILDGVGGLIFDNNLNALLNDYEAALTAEEGQGMSRRRAQHRRARLMLPSELARSYSPPLTLIPEDRRSMFLTFEMGHPLTIKDIVEYFRERWGDCVENVMVEPTPRGVAPMFGRLVFKSAAFVGLVLNGGHNVRFDIKGRQIWARKISAPFHQGV